jgi:putative methionine-R-sulfoxide reductase with GAF domain
MILALHEDIRNFLDRQGTTGPCFDSIGGRLLAAFDAQVAVVYTLDAGTGLLKLRCHRGFEKGIAVQMRFRAVGRGLPGRAASLRQPVQHLPDSESGESHAEPDPFPMGTIFVPMVHESDLRGVLGIGKGFHHEYAPDQIANLVSIANLIAAYLK